MERSAPSRTRTLTAVIAVVLGVVFAFFVWLAWTRGDVPIYEDIPPRHYSLVGAGVAGGAFALLVYHGARMALEKRGAWDR
jgi:hypothetical protein